jgi:hypothetical protein
MLTELTYDLCRQLKHNLARFDNDASACYDRIIVALGMLAARRCGMPEHSIRTHATCLQQMSTPSRPHMEYHKTLTKAHHTHHCLARAREVAHPLQFGLPWLSLS